MIGKTLLFYILSFLYLLAQGELIFTREVLKLFSVAFSEARPYINCQGQRFSHGYSLTTSAFLIPRYLFLLQGKSPLAGTQWLRVVLDEGHVIRNPNAMMSKAVHALKSERRWVVTGTPIQNSMKDMFSVISFLKLEPFTDRQWWRRTMERPISEGDQSALRYGKIISVGRYCEERFICFRPLIFADIRYVTCLCRVKDFLQIEEFERFTCKA